MYNNIPLEKSKSDEKTVGILNSLSISKRKTIYLSLPLNMFVYIIPERDKKYSIMVML